MRGMGDLLLSLVENDTYLGSFHVNNSASVSLVLAFDYAHLITRLEVLANTANVHLQLLGQLDTPIVHRVKSDLALFNRDNRSLDTAKVASRYANLVTLGILGGPACPHRLDDHGVGPLRIARLGVFVVISLLRLLDASKEVVQLLVIGLHICREIDLLLRKRFELEAFVEKLTALFRHYLPQCFAMCLGRLVDRRVII